MREDEPARMVGVLSLNLLRDRADAAGSGSFHKRTQGSSAPRTTVFCGGPSRRRRPMWRFCWLCQLELMMAYVVIQLEHFLSDKVEHLPVGSS